MGSPSAAPVFASRKGGALKKEFEGTKRWSEWEVEVPKKVNMDALLKGEALQPCLSPARLSTSLSNLIVLTFTF